MGNYRDDSVESLHKAGFTTLRVTGVGEVEGRDETIAKLKAAITRIDTTHDANLYGGFELEAAIKAAVELVEGKV